MASYQLFGILNDCAREIERKTEADVLLYYGPIDINYKILFTKELERLALKNNRKKLYFVITTGGGQVEMAEVMVEVMRHFYDEVYFVVPNYAYSAGTILCMSGDKLFMNYYSSLGPIDPQVFVNGKFVSSQGYIEQFELIKEKSKTGEISQIEMQMALNLNLADLNSYIQLRNHTVTLLKKWLVQYKFKDWNKHTNTNAPVTDEEKIKRAEEIALKLGDNRIWHLHTRPIGINTLRSELNLKIEDLGENKELADAFNNYEALATDVCAQNHWPIFIHTYKE